MPKCVFDKLTGKYLGGSRYDDPSYDPATQVVIVLADFPDPSAIWDGATGVRSMTEQERSSIAAVQLDAEATKFVDGISAGDRLIFKVLFDHESRVRILENKASITPDQYKSSLVALYKTL